jgi:hypothetical protein
MKKILLAIALVSMIGLGASAQRFGSSDSFFNNWEDVGNGLDKFDDFDNLRGGEPVIPGGHGSGNDVPAPLGSGIAVLTALGAGYAFARRKRD